MGRISSMINKARASMEASRKKREEERLAQERNTPDRGRVQRELDYVDKLHAGINRRLKGRSGIYEDKDKK